MTIIEEKHAESLTMRATHALCGCEGCRVNAQFTQATRTEPMTFLGFHAFCPDCQVRFPADAPQLVLS